LLDEGDGRSPLSIFLFLNHQPA